MSQILSDRFDAVDDFDAELRRLVDRLRAMRVERLAEVSDAVHRACAELLQLSAALGDPAPTPLPTLRPTALGDQLAVVGADLRRNALSEGDAQSLHDATEALVALRRST